MSIDISSRVEADSMPLCPLCDNAIMEHDPVVLVFAHGAKGIAHQMCTEDEE